MGDGTAQRRLAASNALATVGRMRIGIDFGTTRTVVAMADRGNYPVVSFDDADGDAIDFVPSIAAETRGRVVYGFDAAAAARTGAPLLRSFKRVLAEPGAGYADPVRVGGIELPLADLVTGFAAHLERALRSASNIAGDVQAGPIRCVLGVPAHAPTGQRMLTIDAFGRAGFEVDGMMNEPSAAAFEYTHRYPRSITSRRSDVIVFDLGGGTFDASLVRVEGREHRILASVGDSRLGGDDFDDVLAGVALGAAGRAGERPDAHLLEEARAAKEQITPQTRRLTLDTGPGTVTLGVDEFYRAATPLVDRCTAVMAPLLSGDAGRATSDAELAGMYLVGGASGLPLVPRTLRERFGRRVHRSPHPSASTAIGLAIAADPGSGYRLLDRLTRGIGVFREGDEGSSIVFDLVVDGSAHLPAPGGELVVTRRYRAAHDLGRFRVVEVAGVDERGAPSGDIVPLAELDVPFDPALRDGRDLARHEPRRRDHGPLIEETYRVDANRIVRIEIRDVDSGYRVEARGRAPSAPRPAG